MNGKVEKGSFSHPAASLSQVPSARHVPQFTPPRRFVFAQMSTGLREFYLRVSDKQERKKYKASENKNVHVDVFSPCIHDLLANRYRITGIAGRSQSAIIVKAEDTFHPFRKQVAIKILHASYSNLGPQEASCLLHIKHFDTLKVAKIINILNVFTAGQHYCMVFELLQTRPLHEYFQMWPFPSKDDKLKLIRKVAFQITQSLAVLSSLNIIHADIKPENILFQNEDGTEVKIIDFGNALYCIHDEISLYFDEFDLQTIIYRAPEVMFGLPFGLPIDMWSFGCVLAECFLGEPLFLGRTKEEIFEKIQSLLGLFPMSPFQSGKYFSTLKRFVGRSLSAAGHCQTVVNILKKLGTTDYAFADFIARLLAYDPSARIDPFQAMRHPFLASECALGYLSPNIDKECRYSPLMLTPSTYLHRPQIDDQIKKMHYSPLELLHVGTRRTEDGGEKVVRVLPFKYEENACVKKHDVEAEHDINCAGEPATDTSEFSMGFSQVNSETNYHEETGTGSGVMAVRFSGAISQDVLSENTTEQRVNSVSGQRKRKKGTLGKCARVLRSASRSDPTVFKEDKLAAVRKKRNFRRNKHASEGSPGEPAATLSSGYIVAFNQDVTARYCTRDTSVGSSVMESRSEDDIPLALFPKSRVKRQVVSVPGKSRRKKRRKTGKNSLVFQSCSSSTSFSGSNVSEKDNWLESVRKKRCPKRNKAMSGISCQNIFNTAKPRTLDGGSSATFSQNSTELNCSDETSVLSTVIANKYQKQISRNLLSMSSTEQTGSVSTRRRGKRQREGGKNHEGFESRSFHSGSDSIAFEENKLLEVEREKHHSETIGEDTPKKGAKRSCGYYGRVLKKNSVSARRVKGHDVRQNVDSRLGGKGKKLSSLNERTEEDDSGNEGCIRLHGNPKSIASFAEERKPVRSCLNVGASCSAVSDYTGVACVETGVKDKDDDREVTLGKGDCEVTSFVERSPSDLTSLHSEYLSLKDKPTPTELMESCEHFRCGLAKGDFEKCGKNRNEYISPSRNIAQDAACGDHSNLADCSLAAEDLEYDVLLL